MKRMLLVIAFLSAIITAHSQSETMITFEEALGMTMEGNPTIKALDYSERAAQMQRKAAVGLRMPKITVAGNYTHLGSDMNISLNDAKSSLVNGATGMLTELGQTGLVPPALLGPISNALSSIGGMDWTMTLQQKDLAFIGGSVVLPIFMGGKINVANKAARIQERTTLVEGDSQRSALVSELVTRYYGLALAMQVVQVRQQVVDGVRVHLEDAQALERSGMISRGEVLYAQYKMSEAERELEAAKLQVKTLREALGNTVNHAGELVPVSAMFIIEDMEGVEYYKSMAEQHNPILSQVSLKKDLAKQNVRAHLSEFLPQIVAMGGGTFYNYQVSNLVPRWAVGVGVSLTIFDGTSREFKYSSAKSTFRQVEAIETKARSEIGVLIDNLYNQLTDYKNQIPSIEASMAFADEYLRIQNSSFREGMVSSTSVIDAELNLAKVKVERMQAAYNYDVALARLLEAAGISGSFVEYASGASAKQIRYE